MVTFKDFLIKSKFNVKKAKLYQESYDKIMESGLFDKNYYLKAYPNVKKSGMDPLIHYLFYDFEKILYVHLIFWIILIIFFHDL